MVVYAGQALMLLGRIACAMLSYVSCVSVCTALGISHGARPSKPRINCVYAAIVIFVVLHFARSFLLNHSILTLLMLATTIIANTNYFRSP